MANELKPCPFCGAEPSSSFTDMKAVIKCEPCGFAMEHSTVIVSLRVAEDVQRRVVTKRWNTRPAEPVEGLETVGIQHLRSVDGKWHYGEAEYANQDERELVTRSKAEAIIAAKDARIDELEQLVKDLANNNGQDVLAMLQSLKHSRKLEADNAALTARVKHFEDAIKAKGGNEHSPTQDAYELACKAIDKHRDRAEALETQLAAGTVTFHLKWIAGARPPVHPEPMTGRLSFGNFDKAIAFMQRQAADAKFVSLIERTEIQTDRSQEARAALEGKP